MAIEQSITEPRNVKVAFDANTGKDILDEVAQIVAPVDAFKAALELVKQNEGLYAKLGAAGVPDVTAKTILCTGANPFQVHVFTVTTVMATGNYIFIYVQTKPNADS